MKKINSCGYSRTFLSVRIKYLSQTKKDLNKTNSDKVIE